MKNYMLWFATLLVLTGCHESPLNGKKDAQVIQFLLSASKAAEGKTSFQDLKGSGYVLCMTRNSLHLDCQRFFEDMVQFAKEDSGFRGLKTGDIRDQAVFRRLETGYRQKQFDSQ